MNLSTTSGGAHPRDDAAVFLTPKVASETFGGHPSFSIDTARNIGYVLTMTRIVGALVFPRGLAPFSSCSPSQIQKFQNEKATPSFFGIAPLLSSSGIGLRHIHLSDEESFWVLGIVTVVFLLCLYGLRREMK